MPFENKLDILLKELQPHASQIASLSGPCNICIQAAIEGYRDANNGRHLRQDVIAAIAEMKASLDLDQYIYGPDLPE